ncbi:DNA-3-methyladenine glycosylase 2 family protein [Muribacter muris]|uniref:DNA-3-methyladenine glycosylase 2 family protein n=1 Tax=Muribacter muris TaxID=67855 RepID=A0A4Y9JYU0_9PAST|nr:Ada metal-binding domain-containing protein [Muribacter muris]MBF0785343.1 helix-turn-helix domain-containing protein [Muribacter muris]MBF0825998.1 helix-turn-helix domain-containing protein [Muribacter muris]TFV09606.1 DNA-3-methyladenine glycosylase 2 family protein [Muribacter muris]
METIPLYIYQQARLSRDPRFDGKFFIAVKSTGIFCRTICPVKLPLEKNVKYFNTREEAIEEGFRPCLRCKPEYSPKYNDISKQSIIVNNIISKIQAGELITSPITKIAAKVFTSPRNLNKMFVKYCGMSLKKFQNINKAIFAQKLLTQSNLSIIEISNLCGYSYITGLYELLYKHTKISPGKIKSMNEKKKVNFLTKDKEVHIRIPYFMNYDWSYFLSFQSKRLIASVESIDGNMYSRNIIFNGIYGRFRIFPENKSFNIFLSNNLLPVLPEILRHISEMFDLNSNIALIESSLSSAYPELTIKPGLHIPGVFCPFEAGVRAICGQQVSVAAATNLLNQFVTIFSRLDKYGNTYFPLPSDIKKDLLNKLNTMSSKKQHFIHFLNGV